MTVAPVRTRAELTAFLDLPARLGREEGSTALRVPLLRSEIRSWHTGRTWFPEPIELLLARTGGTVTGRTTAHRSAALDARLSTGLQALAPTVRALCFGATEFADEHAAAELFEALGARARNTGCTHLFGPVSPLPNTTGGVVTAGFAERGFFDSPWNPAHVPAAYEAHGFTRWAQADSWIVDLGAVPAARATAPTASEAAAGGVRLRHPSRLGARRFVRRLRPTLNRAFAALPYYTEIGPEQMAGQTAGLEALMDPALVVTADGLDDPPAAPPRCFALVVPDPTAILQRHDGRLGPRAAAELLASHRTRGRDAILLIQGTDPDHSGSGLLTLVLRQVYANLIAGGYRRLRVTSIGRDNPGSAAVFDRAGGRPLHGLTTYVRDLR